MIERRPPGVGSPAFPTGNATAPSGNPAFPTGNATAPNGNATAPSGSAWRLGSVTLLALLALGCEGDNLFQPGPGRGPDRVGDFQGEAQAVVQRSAIVVIAFVGVGGKKGCDQKAEGTEDLMEKYLEEGELSKEEIKEGIRARTLANEIVPVLGGSAFKNKGVQAVLDAVIEYMPSPTEVKAIEGHLLDRDETPASREADDEAPFAALAFKIATDPFVGTLTFFRVYSGKLESGTAVFNSVKEKKERVGRMVQMHSNSREEIKEVLAGDIAADELRSVFRTFQDPADGTVEQVEAVAI